MKKLVFLEYAFIFGDDTFDNLYDFEKLLSQVFKVKGYEARIIDALRKEYRFVNQNHRSR